MGIEGELRTIPEAATQIVTPVVETESKLTAPLIDHEGRVVRIEERQAQHQEEMVRQLAGLEERMQSASASQMASLQERFNALEARMAAPVEEAGVPDESVELTLPDVETSPEPPEKLRQGMRHRRKAKRKGK
jgi:hypothetical protein